MKKDSLEDLLDIWVEAENRCPGIRKDSFDSGKSVVDVKAEVIKRLDSSINLEGKSKDYISGIYDVLSTKAPEPSRSDADDIFGRIETLTSPKGSPRQDSAPPEGSSLHRMTTNWKNEFFSSTFYSFSLFLNLRNKTNGIFPLSQN